MVLTAPRESTDGLTVLRHFRPEDVAPFAAFMAEPANTRHMTFPDDVKNVDDAAGIIRTTIEAYGAPGPALALAICRAVDPTLIGACGAHEAGADEVEIFYLILKAHRRQGHARRAATLLTDHLRHAHPDKALIAFIAPENKGSKQIIEGLGFRDEGEMVVNDKRGRRYVSRSRHMECGDG